MFAMDNERVCSTCGTSKQLEDFPEYKAGHRKKVCKVCNENTRRKRIGATYESYLDLICKQSKSKNRKKDVLFTIDTEHLCGVWAAQQGRCALSGVMMTHHKDGLGRKDFNASMDRIVPEYGYVPGNVQLVCDRVNTMRHTLSMDMFYWWIKCIHEHSCD